MVGILQGACLAPVHEFGVAVVKEVVRPATVAVILDPALACDARRYKYLRASEY